MNINIQDGVLVIGINSGEKVRVEVCNIRDRLSYTHNATGFQGEICAKPHSAEPNLENVAAEAKTAQKVLLTASDKIKLGLVKGQKIYEFKEDLTQLDWDELPRNFSKGDFVVSEGGVFAHDADTWGTKVIICTLDNENFFSVPLDLIREVK